MRLVQKMEKPSSRDLLEAAIARALHHYDLEVMGGCHSKIEVRIVSDMVIARLGNGVRSPAERGLAHNPEAAALFKRMHRMLFDQDRDTLVRTIESLCESRVEEVYTDVAVRSPEYLIVFTLNRTLEER